MFHQLVVDSSWEKDFDKVNKHWVWKMLEAKARAPHSEGSTSLPATISRTRMKVNELLRQLGARVELPLSMFCVVATALAIDGRTQSRRALQGLQRADSQPSETSDFALHFAALFFGPVAMQRLLDRDSTSAGFDFIPPALQATIISPNNSLTYLDLSRHWSTLLPSSPGLADKVDRVKLLLADSNVDVNLQNSEGLTALHLAAQRGLTDMVHLLLEHPEIQLDPNENMRSPLSLAAEFGHLQLVRVLLDAEDDVADPRWRHDDTIHTVALKTPKNGEDILALLLDNGADITARIGQMITVLQAACIGGNSGIVDMLLSRGAETAPALYLGRNWQYFSHLHAAASRGWIEVVEVLLRHRVSNARDIFIPYHLLCDILDDHHKDLKTIHGQDSEDHHKDDRQAIILLLLKAHSTGRDLPDHIYGMALARAASVGCIWIVQALLDCGVAPHGLPWTFDAGSALQGAARHGHAHVVQLLLQRGADVHVTLRPESRSAIELAAAEGHDSIVSLLLEHGARLDKPVPSVTAATNDHLRPANGQAAPLVGKENPTKRPHGGDKHSGKPIKRRPRKSDWVSKSQSQDRSESS